MSSFFDGWLEKLCREVLVNIEKELLYFRDITNIPGNCSNVFRYSCALLIRI